MITHADDPAAARRQAEESLLTLVAELVKP